MPHPSSPSIAAACLGFLLAAGSVLHAAPAKVEPVPLPSIYKPSKSYTVKANGVEVPVVDYVSEYDYAQFSMSEGTCEIEIVAKNVRDIEAYSISPLKLEIPSEQKGNRITFKIEKNQYLIVWVRGAKKLVITADPQETYKPAASGPGIYNVVRYGADPTGGRASTQAIQKAIDEASAKRGGPQGQGVVVVPPGVFKTANLVLKSNVDLYLAGGAVLVGTGNPSDYEKHFRKDSKNLDGTWFIHNEKGAKNIRIYGRGTVDGVGREMEHERKFMKTLLMICDSERFVMDGITMRDSGMWANIIARSNDVTISNFKMLNGLNTGEDDALDICESQDVLVKDSLCISLDDPFSTKTWDAETDICRNWYGKPEPLRNVVFENCISWTRCYAFKVGQGVKQPQENVIVRNCVVYDCAIGIGIHHKWGTSSVKNVEFRDIDIENVKMKNDGNRVWGWFRVQNGDKKGGGPVSDVLVENVRVRDAGETAGFVRGFSEDAKIENLRFVNIRMPGSETPAKTLEELNMTELDFSSDVSVE